MSLGRTFRAAARRLTGRSSSQRLVSASALAVALGVVLFPSPAQSEEAKTHAPEVFAPDAHTGHFSAAARAGLSVPFGEAAPGVDYHAFGNSGLGLGADLGFGIARDVVIGAWGDYILSPGSNTCVDCQSTTFGVGAFVRYHLTAGLRIDPWMSYGIGFRSASVESSSRPEDPTLSFMRPGDSYGYAGLEWLRASFGMDWYPTPVFGFGPFAEFGAATFFNTPDGQEGGGVNWRFQTGVRVIIDLPGHR